jgi:hypothetical protein
LDLNLKKLYIFFNVKNIKYLLERGGGLVGFPQPGICPIKDTFLHLITRQIRENKESRMGENMCFFASLSISKYQVILTKK